VPDPVGHLHHVELWVPDLARAVREWGRLLGRLGWTVHQDWPAGRSWRLGAVYLVVERSRDQVGEAHERCRPGLNHLAFHVGADLDGIVDDAIAHGWSLLFADRHPYAGGPGHRAAYLENSDGFEVELVASAAPRPRA
jgi:catechol 2,3-dioxygenase-like lactoylglutathione lyase family enzyme